MNRNKILPVVAFTVLSSVVGYTMASGGGGVLADPGAAEGKHFDPKGKLPSEFTIKAQQKHRDILPFSDARDFDEAKKGVYRCT